MSKKICQTVILIVDKKSLQFEIYTNLDVTKMQITEYKIKLPFSVDEAQIGSIFTQMEARKELDGVKVKHDTPFSGFNQYPGFELYDSGRYTYIEYKANNKEMSERIPDWLLSMFQLPEEMIIHQETWDNFPYILTVTTMPGFFKQNFHTIVESYYGTSDSPPIHENYQTKLGLKKHAAVNIDIANDKIDDYEEGKDPTKCKTGKGPLTSDWQSGEGPFSTVYQTASVNCSLDVDLFNVAEGMMAKTAEQEIIKYFKSLYCFSGEWTKLSLEEVKAMDQTQLNQMKF